MSYLLAKKDETIIADKIVEADCFFKRFTGLYNKKSISSQDGILLIPCSQIHTIGMSFSIDALFLSKNNEIIHIEHGIKPNHVSKYVRRAKKVLELCENTAKDLQLNIGDVIDFTIM